MLYDKVIDSKAVYFHVLLYKDIQNIFNFLYIVYIFYIFINKKYYMPLLGASSWSFWGVSRKPLTLGRVELFRSAICGVSGDMLLRLRICFFAGEDTVLAPRLESAEE